MTSLSTHWFRIASQPLWPLCQCCMWCGRSPVRCGCHCGLAQRLRGCSFYLGCHYSRSVWEVVVLAHRICCCSLTQWLCGSPRSLLIWPYHSHLVIGESLFEFQNSCLDHPLDPFVHATVRLCTSHLDHTHVMPTVCGTQGIHIQYILVQPSC